MLNKKTIVGLAVASLSLVAVGSHAATQGAYFGGTVGYGNVHQKASSSEVKQVESFGLKVNTNKDSGVAGRLFGGYQFNQYVAAEMGWTKFSNAEFKMSGYGFTTDATAKTDAVDLVAKGILPVANNVNVYGKLGAAYVIQRGEFKSPFGSFHNTEKKLLPTAGVGVSYDFNPNLAADLGYNRIQKTGNSNSIKSTDFVGVGLIYSIG